MPSTLNETHSRVLIDAQLAALGWNVQDPNSVRHEVVLDDGAETRFWEWETDAFPRPVKTFFKQDDLERRFTIPERDRAIVREFRQVLENGFTDRKGILRRPLIGKTIVFAVSKRHTETLARLFDAEFADPKPVLSPGEGPTPNIRYADHVVAWLLGQDGLTLEQERWLRAIGSQTKANAGLWEEFTAGHLAFHPFTLMGGLPQAIRVFGGDDTLDDLLGSLNAAVFGTADESTAVCPTIQDSRR